MQLEKEKMAQEAQFKQADMEMAQSQKQEQASQPVINQAGMFNDPHLGQAGQIISSMK